MNNGIKLKLLIFIVFVALVVVLFIGPIPQNPAYHLFSDQRPLWGMPNGWNVISNLPFMVAGLFGLMISRRSHVVVTEINKTILQLFFCGLLFTGFGSCYYHLSPSNASLAWDRLPMTVAFMAFFSFVINMHLAGATARRLLWPLIAVGICSVLYWAYTESIQAGDLRFYGLVQFLPVILIPIMIVLFPNHSYQSRYIWLVIAIYVLAKLFESFDSQLYTLLGISGHSLKHIVAALSGVAFYYALRSTQAGFQR